ncbi:MAG: class I SAM-dependent methyltransferase [Caulobacter sp.]|nr:class I SAM-dependent methyltransferase [Caulobacter sp.]
MPSGGGVLDLGCGGGQDAAVMLEAGLEVDALDGSPLLAAEAERRLGRPVRVMRFEALADEDRYEGVWANASLLHVPTAALPGVIGRVWRALMPGGLLFASFKAGEAPGRDSLGRYFNFLSQEALAAAFAEAADWSTVEIEAGAGGGYDRVERLWLMVWARRGYSHEKGPVEDHRA